MQYQLQMFTYASKHNTKRKTIDNYELIKKLKSKLKNVLKKKRT